ncbi:hypothetical protein D3C86_1563140 [compost metagenome]
MLIFVFGLSAIYLSTKASVTLWKDSSVDIVISPLLGISTSGFFSFEQEKAIAEIATRRKKSFFILIIIFD